MRSVTCIRAQSAMDRPPIRDASAASLSRAPRHAAQTPSARNSRTMSRVRPLIPARSRFRYSRSKRSARPSYSVVHVPPVPCTVTLLPGRPRIRNSRSAAVNARTGLCGSSSSLLVYACPCQVPAANGGKRTAPSARERSGSRMRSQSGRTVRPSPSHSGHMPDGSLNEYAVAGPALGVPCRENSTRSTE
ncbi:hypothetical protein RKD26_000655 [Streptomyces calvus]